jgi:hypothetical protein
MNESPDLRFILDYEDCCMGWWRPHHPAMIVEHRWRFEIIKKRDSRMAPSSYVDSPALWQTFRRGFTASLGINPHKSAGT